MSCHVTPSGGEGYTATSHRITCDCNITSHDIALSSPLEHKAQSVCTSRYHTLRKSSANIMAGICGTNQRVTCLSYS